MLLSPHKNSAGPNSTCQNSTCPGLYHLVQAGDGGICRIRLEQGCITAAQLHQLAKLGQDHGNGIIELTNRANIQLRGILPDRMNRLVPALEEAGLAPKIPAGDGVRNVMINPTAGFDIQGDDRIIILGRQISHHLQTNPRTQTLSPKFSILLDGGEACAVVHHLNDIWLSLCDEGKNFAFGLASRPPLTGESCNLAQLASEHFPKSVKRFLDKKCGKNKGLEQTSDSIESHSALGKVPFAQATGLVFTLIDFLLEMREKQPRIERMKHLTAFLDRATIFDILKQKLPLLEQAKNFYRHRPKTHAHLGIQLTKQADLFYLGIKPPLGRLSSDQAHFIAEAVLGTKTEVELRLTPWQSLILAPYRFEYAKKHASIFKQAGFVTDKNQALAHIICCAGAPACTSAKTDVQTDAMKLAEHFKGQSFPAIHLSGCKKSCAANQAQATTFVGVAEGLYDVFTADPEAASPFGQLIARSINIKQFLEYFPKSENRFLDKKN